MNGRYAMSLWSIAGFSAALLLISSPASHAREAAPAYDPLGYVSDHAGVIDADWRERIRSVCQDLERKTGVEMVVVTVPLLKPYGSANDYATALYQKWGIGSAQDEHGVLVLLSVQERQAAVTMGRRMIPVMGGEVVGRVGHEYLDPAIKNGHFGEGLYRTVVGLASVAQEIRVGSLQKAHFRGLGFWITISTASGALWFLWWLSRPDLRHPYARLRRGEYWGSGQGGFGGNFGGFGGGMGGEGWK
ncbi:MAG: hypothetical protein CV090_10380 [Nitrospira sp. WS238]|nr:hypothetical protein [Nitrospira sp. WS238]